MNLPQRHTIRLTDYDYSQEGLYFVTICCQDKICRFGKINNSEVVLNEAGRIAHEEWLKTPQLRPNVELGEFIIMPNHMHGIIIINNNDVGTNCIRPTTMGVLNTPLQQCGNGEFRSPSQTLGSIIRGYKSAVTKQIKQLYNAPDIRLWQRNYYEHIIRNEVSYKNISDYIVNNPYNWANDDYYNE